MVDTKSRSTKKLILAVVIVAALIVTARFIGIGTSTGATRIGYVQKGGWRDWSASYTLLSGTLRHTLHPDASDDLLEIDVETQSGSIALEIKNKNGDLIFREENMETKKVSVKASEKISVVVHASGHKGSFHLYFTSSEK